ncbi:hypothetical protein E3P99_01778 [Wallemia hederae]|uniref:Brl1/Brr6 domain-containing protein n=1 Tax=Wallemia hederae TaxID=1540922 RepID=A0A4T0FNM6_9BASI|nr:hypothetical protein E3P99_01778 [Wallemia hederae]
MSYGRSMEAPMDFSYSDRPLKRSHNDGGSEAIWKGHDSVKFTDDDRRSNLIGSNTPFLFNRVDVEPNSSNTPHDNFKWDVKASLGLGEVEMTDNDESKLKVSSSAVNKMRKKRIRNQQSRDYRNDNDYNEISTDYKYQYQHLPKLLSIYAHMGFNLFLLLGLSLLAFKLVRTILKDVEHKVQVYVQSLNSESAACARSYALNQCDPSTRVPVSEEACIHFEQCMHRDPTTVGIARVGAAAFAEILEGFANEIGLRGAMLIIVLLGFLWMMRNVGNRASTSGDQRMTIDENEIERFQMFLRSQQDGLNNHNKGLKKRWGGGYKIEPQDALMDRQRMLR